MDGFGVGIRTFCRQWVRQRLADVDRPESLSLGLDDQTKNQLERKRTPGQERKHHHHRTDGFQKRLFGREDQQGLKASVFTVVASADQGFRSQKVS
jgi:hypothetical protein